MSTTGRWLLGSVLVGVAVVGGLALWLWPVLAMLGDPARISRSYYLPAESMLPTLAVGDRVRPLQPRRARLVRGAVIVFEGPGSVRVARIVGVAGDVVAMRGGHLSLDGRPVLLRGAGQGPRLSDGMATRVEWERLPGERGPHRLLDAGASPGDEVPPARVPPSHLYVLGDNRDRAADSRFPLDVHGVGFVSTRKVIGVVDRILWSASFGSRGRPVDAVARP